MSRRLLNIVFKPQLSTFRKMGSRSVNVKKSSMPLTPADRIAGAKPSIWVEFTALATACNATNIGQGFPDEPAPEFVANILKDIAAHPDRTDWHQYTRGFGHPRLVAALSQLYSKLLGITVNAQSEVLVTVGAYLSLYYAFTGWLNHGDEVIIIEPAYDCYVPQVKMAGGVPVPVLLELETNPITSADYHVNLEAIKQKITSRTKMIVLNNPHNPTGKLFTRKELEGIAEIAEFNNLIVIADEVYEWHIYPGNEMIKFASIPRMYDRTITIGSAGKAFSVTGWKLGWAVGPDSLLQPLKAVHQNCIFTCSTPTQEAVAQAFEQEMEIMWSNMQNSYLRTRLAAGLQDKRDKIVSMLRKTGFKPIIPESGYFMLADFSDIGFPDSLKHMKGNDPIDFNFARWLCKEKGLAVIPPSAFFSDELKKGNDYMIRVCFFKSDDVLSAAEKILVGLEKK